MVIIMGKIVKHDILPFLVFATTAVVAFEAASLFFAWVLEFPHEIGTFFRMFTGVGKSRPRLLPCWPQCGLGLHPSIPTALASVALSSVVTFFLM